MNKSGPIVIIEDDMDDQHLLELVFAELRYENEIVFFADGHEALRYLKQDGVYPFLILSDINMPRLTGFELRGKVHTDSGLADKCIPYLFFTTAVNEQLVRDAYKMSVQGFFVKATEYDRLRNSIRKIVEYWQECFSPANYQHYMAPQAR